MESAKNRMRNPPILKGSSDALRSAPQVWRAPYDSRPDQPAQPTATEGLAELMAGQGAYENHDVNAAARRPMAVERLDQLAMEHLLGAR
ncbi:hypothetical protein ACFVXC_22560 [Streptomyces sp. NPDC058257]|uniref:hypothetical protein n=1 Tax=Streptomyces sp. NPDC058257 TaxID=3346409 RepID=UPI0036E36D3C